nr:immunoglobulin heavy chain junction region [Mus musculus]
CAREYSNYTMDYW